MSEKQVDCPVCKTDVPQSQFTLHIFREHPDKFMRMLDEAALYTDLAERVPSSCSARELETRQINESNKALAERSPRIVETSKKALALLKAHAETYGKLVENMKNHRETWKRLTKMSDQLVVKAEGRKASEMAERPLWVRDPYDRRKGAN